MKLFRVEVYVAGMLVDVQSFLSEAIAQQFADEKQDAGYKVRFFSNV
ncbi:MAG TPA: hypothetical protein PK317_00935 [Coprothermobacter proteolyticus]|nr:hypothetical protein [Coprothermobacter proteolyticus]